MGNKVCITPGCNSKRHSGHKLCTTCNYSKYRKKNPIKYWAKNWIYRKNNKRSDVDANIDDIYLIKKARQAIKKFPKLDFINSKSCWYATVDRIDNSSHYKKRNIQILPAFLNHAKHNMTQSEFDEAITEYYLTVLA